MDIHSVIKGPGEEVKAALWWYFVKLSLNKYLQFYNLKSFFLCDILNDR